MCADLIVYPFRVYGRCICLLFIAVCLNRQQRFTLIWQVSLYRRSSHLDFIYDAEPCDAARMWYNELTRVRTQNQRGLVARHEQFSSSLNFERELFESLRWYLNLAPM